MADAFDAVVGQPQVREFLRAAASQGRVSHAYLFCGPAGSNKTAAAYALAQAAVCEQGFGCGTCAECRQVQRRTHPDVRQYTPEGAAGYLVGQVRDIVADAALAPVRARRKVYVLDRVDLLGVQAANAFLKTLEEPPASVLIILLGRTPDSVLPTIVSRCQVVPFRTIPPQEAAGLVAQHAGCTREQAQIALQACDGSLSRAVSFVGSGESKELRRQVIAALEGLCDGDDWDALRAASRLVVQAKAPLDEVRAAQERTLQDNADFLAKQAVRQIEQRNKRIVAQRSLELLHQLASVMRGWLRDVLACAQGAPELVTNTDARDGIKRAAAGADPARLTAALSAVGRYDAAVSYNVSPETCVDAMLLEIRCALRGDEPPVVTV